jgi:hypothetical protein
VKRSAISSHGRFAVADASDCGVVVGGGGGVAADELEDEVAFGDGVVGAAFTVTPPGLGMAGT